MQVLIFLDKGTKNLEPLHKNKSQMRLKLLVLVFTTISISGFSQIVLSGEVARADNKSPVAFVNIGILDSDVGSISEEDGSFSITIPEQYRKARLLFSALGYKRISLSVDSARNFGNLIVLLEESIQHLKPVTVIGEQFKRKYEFGNDDSEGGTVYADTVTAGSAIALLIENKGNIDGFRYPRFKYPALVEKVSVRVAKNTFKEFKIRVRVYSVDSLTGLPGKDLLNKSVVETSRIKKGWLEIDLLKHYIMIDGPFYLGFEWILEKEDRRYLHHQYANWRKRHPELVTVEYSEVEGDRIPYVNYNAYFWAGTSLGMAVSPKYLEQYKCYYRYSSFSKWTRSSSILAGTITLSN
jgi:hypothetical protein